MTRLRSLTLLLGPTVAALLVTGCLAPGAVAAILGITAAAVPVAGAVVTYAVQAQRLAPGAPQASLDDVAKKLEALKRCEDATIAVPDAGASDAGAVSSQALIDAVSAALRDVVEAVKAAQIAAAGKDGGA